ncbi:nucleotide-diphospho-sugar transferase [Cytophagaceae bacterium DM2B3-1]|uniref:Nucleotide-diphospho-sugar transferase n=1 Tax=Xanthocytophaga flava TaxID=3048013 RepID=A0ABT7CNJ8_9BACT|nr:nucleotide-diphospho-sugar transferase [Xanthocytophaga flavus]MDJ1469747.1 nucleotide-diphospho-sugar transferase [Xanthocytophaga flavus]MDJ1494259.1 nucleotide-diphospho-sugar transferase [Xanthocytophaga flavus]
MKTPVLLIIFNRPESSNQVFQAIRKAKPKELFIAADGPRSDRINEAELCQQTRAIVNQVDWDCEVKTLFRDENLGCGLGPSSAISWFFEHVEKGIILEDDCLPNPSFFTFCEYLLEYYADNLNIGQITGCNFQHGQQRGPASYYYSKYFLIWGWATWRNRWKEYSFTIEHADSIIQNKIIDQKSATQIEKDFWYRKLETLRDGQRKDAWDYQWMFANWYLDRLSIVPNTNLISNIGFTETATHTTKVDAQISYLPTDSLQLITHPSVIEEDKKADYYTFHKSKFFPIPTWKDKLRWTLKKILPSKAKNALKQVTK